MLPPLVRIALRFAFRLLYHELAWTYDWVSRVVSLGQWRAWQRAGLRRLGAGPVLELAHGTGDTLLDLQELGLSPVGVEASAAMGRLAQRKLRRHGAVVPPVRARGQALPFASGAFSCILSTFPTEFILDPATWAEAHRVLRPGGRLVVIPVARITGQRASDRLGKWLFHVTGQSDLGPFEALGQVPGFEATVEVDHLPRSDVVIVTLIAQPMPKRHRND